MDLKNALKSFFGGEDRAVSPVIGVILMVAITVILAAVIGTFVLGLGDRVSEASPNAQYNFAYNAVGNNEHVNITHDGGDGVESAQLSVQIDGQEVWNAEDGAHNGATINASKEWTGKTTAGATLALDDENDRSTIEDGDTVKVVWSAPGSDKTAVIGEGEVNF